MHRVLLVTLVVALVGLSTPSVADWDPGQSYKWVQLPDLGTTGLDVGASAGPDGGRVLGDDFPCTETGPITDIHLWGSWLQDVLPFGEDPNAATFTLSIWSDMPAGPGGEFSRPNQELWRKVFGPDQFTSRISAEGLTEGWFGPPDLYLPNGDSICWQYNFRIDESEAFVQEGTPQEPVTYWLVIQADPEDDDARFGWKTSVDHWNDDAVWGPGVLTSPYPGDWYELRYPSGHQMQGQSIDFAFVITDSIPPTYEFDYGDAPAPYRTLNADNGAKHRLVEGMYLGHEGMADTEPDGQPDPDALGDDNNMLDDESTLSMTPLYQAQAVEMSIYASVDGYLDAWIDFAQDGSWFQPIDQVLASRPLTGGVFNDLVFVVPAGAVPGPTFMRLRYSLTGGLAPSGPADSGEVEDHAVTIVEGERFKRVQLPDPNTTGIDIQCNYQYLAADDFECRRPGRLTSITVWGSWEGDVLPGGDAANVDFELAIHEDIPAWSSGTYSMPGTALWTRTFPSGSFTVEPYIDNVEEGWMEPPSNYWFPGDWTIWEYTFTIPPPQAYHQTGTPEDPDTLWLSLQAYPHGEAAFGWKTSTRHWNDDAVWGLGAVPHPGPWEELLYPPTHQWAGESINLAFGFHMGYGTGVPDDVIEDSRLRQNVPNPFNPETTIEYSVHRPGHVTLEVFDSRGRLVRTLVNETENQGEKSVSWDGCDDSGRRLPSGVYFYRLTAEGAEVTRKTVILK